MELVSYLGKTVHIVLKNEFYFIGKVIEADKSSLTLIDKREKRVSLDKESIAQIREVEG